MAKINYSKVEEALNAGLTKMSIEELDKLAKIYREIGRPELRKLAEKAVEAAMVKAQIRKAMLHVLRQGEKTHFDDEFYKEFNLTHTEFGTLLNKGKELTEEDWGLLDKIKVKISAEKEAQIKENPEFQDEKIVEKNRKNQVNARINIKKTWLPLK